VRVAVLGVALHEKPAALARASEVAAEGLEVVGKTAKELFTPKAWDIAKGVKKLSGELVDLKPQVDAAGNLQNYFVGSVASTLLAKAGRFTELPVRAFLESCADRQWS